MVLVGGTITAPSAVSPQSFPPQTQLLRAVGLLRGKVALLLRIW